MKHFLTVILLVAFGLASAQDFITRGKIEYEIKRNNKQIFANDEANRDFLASLPEYDLSYRELTFSQGRSIYKPGRKASPPTIYQNENEVYTDVSAYKSTRQVDIMAQQYVYEDSVRKIKWKIQNETRKIAGFTCRKALGRIQDSVYVVAFYCPEIVSQGGPELFTGLPGMILGLAIPRYHTTWFATKIEVANVDERIIVPPSSKKSKKYAIEDLSELLFKLYKKNGVWKEVTPEKVKNSLTGYTL